MIVTVNGRPREVGSGAARTVLGYLRDELGLTGAKPGCGEGACGACTVLVDGQPVLSCREELSSLDGRSVTTIEGLAPGSGLHPVQSAILREHAYQCGYCTPAMCLRAAALLGRCARPTTEQIVEAMDPNLCRCGCYGRIVSATHAAAEHPGDLADSAPGAGGTGAAAHRVLPRPRRPWDLCTPEERDYFDLLGPGLVAVVESAPPAPGFWSTGSAAWLHIGPAGDVTVFCGKVNVGQDNESSFSLLVSEELAVGADRIRMVMGDTDVCPFDIGTFGSRSMPDSGQALGRCAAGARRLLVGLAAVRWGVTPSMLHADGGRVVDPETGGSVTYGELVSDAQSIELIDDEPPLRPPAEWTVAGHPPPVGRGRDVVTGDRRFISDLDRPDIRHAVVLRPPVPGSALRGVDLAAARSMDGVEVVSDGELIAALACTPALARRAVAAIDAVWEPPPVGPDDVEGHLRNHPIPGEGWERAVDDLAGDVDRALSTAAIRIDATYTTAFVAHAPIETRAAVAEWDGDRCTVWVGTNTPFAVRSEVAEAVGVDEERVRIVVPPFGSGFGGKHAGDVAIEAARLSRAVPAPVKVHWSRQEELQWGYLRPMAVIDVSSGLDDDRSLSVWDFTDINAGPAALGCPYRVPARRLRYQPAASPLVQGPFRALAATANNFARESHIDELARAAGRDPVEFRLSHLDDDRLVAVVRSATERFGWPSPASGVAIGLEKGGRVATCASVEVGDDRRVVVQRIVTAYECGAIVDPDTVRNQVDGCLVMGLGGALFESVRLDHARLSDPSLSSYRIPRFSDIPPIEVVLLDRPDLPSAGAGETPIIAIAPAIANAIFAATGVRIRTLPLVPDGRLPA